MKRVQLLFAACVFLASHFAFGKSIAMPNTQFACENMHIGVEDLASRPDDIWAQARGEMSHYKLRIFVDGKSLLTQFEPGDMQFFDDSYDRVSLESMRIDSAQIEDYHILDERNYFGRARRTMAVKFNFEGQAGHTQVHLANPWFICTEYTVL